jgi:hypothetical protein
MQRVPAMALFGVLTLLAWGFSGGTGCPSMGGIRIGDEQKVLEAMKLRVMVKEDGMTKYRTANGNDLSITVENSKVVYLENDWSHVDAGAEPLISGFRFGITSLKEVREKFGTNGFAYVERPTLKTEEHAITFNCFELEGCEGQVLVVICRVPLSADVSEANIAAQLKVDAFILADSKYLGELWGEERILDPNYRKVRL